MAGPSSRHRGWHRPTSDSTDLDVVIDGTVVGTWDDATNDLVLPTNGLTVTAGGITLTADNLAVTAGSVLSASATAGIGYSTGAGGTVTQGTSKSTGATMSNICGAVTMHGAALAADTTVAFTLTNTAVAATDSVIVLHESAGTLGAYSFGSTAGSGSVVISVHNNTPGSLSEAIVLRVLVVKSVSA